MICTGSVMASFQIPIIILSQFIALYVAEKYGIASGFIAGLFSVLVGLAIFNMWWSGEWPFNRKRRVKAVD